MNALSPPSIHHRCSRCQMSVLGGVRPPISCPSCHELNTFEVVPFGEYRAPVASRRRAPWMVGRPFSAPFKLPLPTKEKARLVDPSTVTIEPYQRSSTGVKGFDHVLGGGLAEGYVVMVAGPPGAGKSTICTQAASAMHVSGMHFGEGVIYGSAEEDHDAVIETANRVAVANFPIALSTSVQDLIEAMDSSDAAVWIIDSLMAITHDAIAGAPGSPSQINACVTMLYERSHATGVFRGKDKRSILIIAHGTKMGEMAGPLKALHSVDGGVLMEHVSPVGVDDKEPWAPIEDQTRPTGFVGARVFRKMRKASNRRVSHFAVQPEELPNGEKNPVGGRLDDIDSETYIYVPEA